MTGSLIFPAEHYEVKTLTLDGETIVYRAYKGLDYCLKPKDPIQKMNLFAPEVYYEGGSISGYTLHTAPVFMPNTVGGYMPGPADEPGQDHRSGQPNTIFRALCHGYVVASPGIRGRTTGKETTEFFEGSKEGMISENSGRLTGRAPALIVDLKAAVRYLRYNRERIPGDPERIVTNGTSAGGALSALAGASGNSAEYEPCLKEIGAAEERDDVFAASCYCPIHNLENADAAYEWQFSGVNEYHAIRFSRTPDGHVKPSFFNGELDEKGRKVSSDLKRLFPSYVNSLGLRAPCGGGLLTLGEDGKGPFLDFLAGKLKESAQKELDTHTSAVHRRAFMAKGSDVEQVQSLRTRDGKAAGIDWEAYVREITRMKPAPAFDALDLSSPENEEFGTETVEAKHFSEYSFAHSEANGEMADATVIRLMNPLSFAGKADTAKHWRIRHGSFDRDTSLAIPLILAVKLENLGYRVDFEYPWGLVHSGDYDLEELFSWIDAAVKQEQASSAGGTES